MESKSSYFIAGAFFCIVMIFVVVFLLFMNKNGNADEYRSYYIQTKELPNGIKKDAQVRFIGVPAGIVKDIYFSDPKTATIEIKLSIKKDLPIKKDSVAVVEIQGISGIASINISKGSPEARTFAADEKPVIFMEQGLLAKIGDNAVNVSHRLNLTLSKFGELLSDKNIKALSQTLDSINKFSSFLNSKENIEHIKTILSSTNKTASALSKIKFEELANQLNAFLVDANRQAKLLEQTQMLLAKKIESGEYDFKSIISPTLQNTNDTLSELNGLIAEIQNTLFRLEDNPYEFFFKDTGDKK
ncbi:MlaD family protein [Campylobacter hyointestinalis]|uniref:MCE family protein n=1 Tax=Campylobacter hyointestinalis subsp. lawsonii TaxID=91353 RepID=A0AAV6EED2_CAMHY|nr:MlaD family protein [Campylobacter hyointestinalis]KAB0612077.1 MCE family protein [Campylobacter hyointestinalis subsp. lawsonii]QKF69337.1 lipid asymmetry ABC transporter MlaABCDEF, periplasmic component MlaD [Campylobacter hyointestinalis subsp. lawsonii]RAZ28252.1 MCE family protein [Campylobacter hyointestinalis subsp. lawsonii]